MNKLLQNATVINHFPGRKAVLNFLFFTMLTAAATLQACKEETVGKKLKQMDSARTAQMAASIESLVKPELAEGLTLRLWGVDYLVVAPVGIDIDDFGRVYFTSTNRGKNSEFDIR